MTQQAVDGRLSGGDRLASNHALASTSCARVIALGLEDAARACRRCRAPARRRPRRPCGPARPCPGLRPGPRRPSGASSAPAAATPSPRSGEVRAARAWAAGRVLLRSAVVPSSATLAPSLVPDAALPDLRAVLLGLVQGDHLVGIDDVDLHLEPSTGPARSMSMPTVPAKTICCSSGDASAFRCARFLRGTLEWMSWDMLQVVEVVSAALWISVADRAAVHDGRVGLAVILGCCWVHQVLSGSNNRLLLHIDIGLQPARPSSTPDPSASFSSSDLIRAEGPGLGAGRQRS